MHVLHAVLEFVVALHVVVHVAADLDGVALPETVVRPLDLLRHQRVELQRGAQAGADLVLVLVGGKSIQSMLRLDVDINVKQGWGWGVPSLDTVSKDTEDTALSSILSVS